MAKEPRTESFTKMKNDVCTEGVCETLEFFISMGHVIHCIQGTLHIKGIRYG